MRHFKAPYALVGLFLFLDVVFGTKTVLAHDYRPTRQAIVQIDDAGGALLWRIELRGDYAKLWRRAHLLALSDGAVQNVSNGALIRLWAKAVEGVEFTIDGTPLKLSGAKMHLEENREDKLVLLGLVEFSLSKKQTDSSVRLSCVMKKDGPNLNLRAQGLGQWKLMGTHSVEAGHSSEAQILRFQEKVELEFIRVQS